MTTRKKATTGKGGVKKLKLKTIKDLQVKRDAAIKGGSDAPPTPPPTPSPTPAETLLIMRGHKLPPMA